MPQTILISAGHSTTDPGAKSKDGALVEAALTLKMRDMVVKILRAKGHSVLTDGADGINEPLQKALALARQVKGPKIEMHLNSFAKPSATGIECLSKPAQKPLARALAKAIAQATGLPLRGSDGGWKDSGSGQHSRLAFCEAGGVIIEPAFISSPSDMAIYLGRQKEIAQAIASVIEGRLKG